MQTSEPQARILVVDDEPQTAVAIERMVAHFGHDVVGADSAEAAIRHFTGSSIDVVLTDLNLGRTDGLELLRRMQEHDPTVPVVLITGYATANSAMEAIQAGAYDYLPKPPTLEAIGALLRRAIEKKRNTEANRRSELVPEVPGLLDEIVSGKSSRMLDVYKVVARVAMARSSVLILGESGTGKELVARALHRRSPRADRDFVPVNVSAIPEGLLESELFGHVRGAFTGASSSRRGLFDQAHLGTLFLDEIGDLTITLQAKLLRVLQEHRFKPVGSNEETEVDVRVVGATHRNLEEMVRLGRFREDLYYRLNVVSVSLPPLRERREDIPILIEHFLRKYSQQTGRPAPGVSPEAMRRAMDFPWPGNVRQLENVIERAVVLSTQGVIGPEAMPPRLPWSGGAIAVDRAEFPSLDEIIQRYVEEVLAHTGGNRTRAAMILGISRRTLHRMAERERQGATRGSDDLTHIGQD
jgi:two-component system response regulator AtoC